MSKFAKFFVVLAFSIVLLSSCKTDSENHGYKKIEVYVPKVEYSDR